MTMARMDEVLSAPRFLPRLHLLGFVAGHDIPAPTTAGELHWQKMIRADRVHDCNGLMDPTGSWLHGDDGLGGELARLHGSNRVRYLVEGESLADGGHDGAVGEGLGQRFDVVE